ncbi:MAG: hypothetical protein FWC02_00960 [Firmicutes bacterium]|nr:hypothetical protein [Bacillota bacterium]
MNNSTRIRVPININTSNNNWVAQAPGTINGRAVTHNPATGVGATRTITVSQPIPLGASMTIAATNLWTDADAIDGVFLTGVSAGNAQFSRTLVQGISGLAGAYSSVTINSLTPTAGTGWQRLTFTLVNIERYTGGHGTQFTGRSEFARQTVHVDFRTGNVRPFYRGDTRFVGTVPANTGDVNDVFVNLSLDNTNGPTQVDIPINALAHSASARTFNTAAGVVLPANEWLPVSTEGHYIGGNLRAGSIFGGRGNNWHGLGATGQIVANPQTHNGQAVGRPTGFAGNEFAIRQVGSAVPQGTLPPWITWQFVNNTTLRLVANAPSRNLFASNRLGGVRGHFYILVRVNCPNDTADGGIWMPIIVQVNRQQIAGYPPGVGCGTYPCTCAPCNCANCPGGGNNPPGPSVDLTYPDPTSQGRVTLDANGRPVTYFTPFGVGMRPAGLTQLTGAARRNELWNAVGDRPAASQVVTASNNRSFPFVANNPNDMIVTNAAFPTGTSAPFAAHRTDPIFIYHNGPTTQQLIAGLQPNAHWYMVELVDFYVLASIVNLLPLSERNNLVTAGIFRPIPGTDLALIRGFRVTGLRATLDNVTNVFVEYGANTIFSRAFEHTVTPPASARMIHRAQIRVQNTALQAVEDNQVGVGLSQWFVGRTPNVGAIPRFEFHMYHGDEFRITPYDLVRDIDTSAAITRYNSSWHSAAHQTAINAANQQISTRASNTAVANVNTRNMRLDTLYFGNIVGVPSGQSVATIERVQGGVNVFDHMIIRAVAFNPAFGLQARIPVRDRSGLTIEIYVYVRVNNSPPRLRPGIGDNVYHLTTGDNGYNRREFTFDYLLVDPDPGHNMPRIVADSIEIMTRRGVNGEFILLPGGTTFVNAYLAPGTGANLGHAEVLHVVARSATIGLRYGLYVQFMACDQFGMQPARQLVQLRFEVNDTAPVLDRSQTENSGLNPSIFGADVQDWTIQGRGTTGQDRFISSHDDLGLWLSNQGRENPNTNLFFTAAHDLDQNHSVIPVASTLNLNTVPSHRIGYAQSFNNLDGGSSPAHAVWATRVNDAGNGLATNTGFVYNGREHIELQFFQRIVGGFQRVYSPTSVNFANLYWAVVIHAQRGATDVIVNIRLAATNATVTYNNGTPLALGYTGGIGSPNFAHAGGVRNAGTIASAPLNTTHSILRVRVVQAEGELRDNFAYFAPSGIYYAVDDFGAYETDGFRFVPVNVPVGGNVQIPLSYIASFEYQQRDPHLATRGIGFWNMTTGANNTGAINFTQTNSERLLSNFRVIDPRWGTVWSGNEANPFVNITFNNQLNDPSMTAGVQNYINVNPTGTGAETFRWILCPGIVARPGAYAGLARAEGWFIEDRIQFNLSKNRMRTNNHIYIEVDLAVWNVTGNHTFNNRVTNAERKTVRFPVHVQNSPIEIIGGTHGQHLDGVNATPARAATGRLNTFVGNATTPIMLSTRSATIDGANVIHGWDQVPAGANVDSSNAVVFNVTDNDNINFPTPTLARNNVEALRYRDAAMFSTRATTWTGLVGCGDIDCGTITSDGGITTVNDDCCERGRLIAFARGSSPQAQRVRGEFFGVSTVAGLDTLPANFNPNPMMEHFFALTPMMDSPLLSLTPLRQTELNMDILLAELAAMPHATDVNSVNTFVRNEFGLSRAVDGRFYFPLTLIAYDTFDNSGFMNASFDVVNVQVFINNTPARVNNALMTTVGNNHVINSNAYVKTIRMFATGDNSTTVNISHIINDENMRLRNLVGGDRVYYTGQDVRAITDSNPTIQLLNRLTTDYIGIIDVRNETATMSASGVPLVDPRTGGALVTYYITSGDSVNNNVGFITTSQTLGSVTRYTQGSQFIRFQAHARLPVLGPNEPSAQFRMQFFDNSTDDTSGVGVINTVLFNIIIMNAPPEVRPEVERFRMPGQEIVMRSGDSFTLLTTPYSHSSDLTVAGGRAGELTFSCGIGSNSVNRFPGNLAGRPSTSEGWSFGPNMPFIRQYTRSEITAQAANVHLGFMPIFTDDTPWALRFNTQAGFLSYDNNVFNRPTFFNYMYPERAISTQGAAGAPTAITFVAHGAAARTPITVAVFDEVAGSMASFRFYVTVVSSPPRPILPESDRDLGPNIDFYGWDGSVAIYTTEIDMFTNTDITLYHMAYDIDTGDTALMFFGMFGTGSRFMMAHSHDVYGLPVISPIFMPQSTGDFVSVTMLSHNTLRLHAHNFELNAASRPFTAIRMMAMDASDPTVGHLLIELRVFINIAEFEVSSVQNLEVKSVYEYENRHIAPAYRPLAPITPSFFQLIGRPGATCRFTNNAPIFFDNDFGALNSSYTVTILSMRNFNELPGGTLLLNGIYTLSDMNRIWNDNTVEGIAYRERLTIWNGAAPAGERINQSNLNAHVWSYIDINEFDVRVHEGVPTIVMVPVMGSTIVNGQARDVQLWIHISKNLNRSDDGLTTITRERATMLNFNVRNSPLLAIGDTASNFRPEGAFTVFSGNVTDSRYFPILNHEMVSDQALFRALDRNDFVRHDSVNITVLSVFKINPQTNQPQEFSTLVPSILQNNLNISTVVTGNFYSLRVNIYRKPITATLASAPTHVRLNVSVMNAVGMRVDTEITVIINNHPPEFTTDFAGPEGRLPANVTLGYAAGGVLTMNITLATNVMTVLRLADFVRDIDWALNRDELSFVTTGATPAWERVSGNEEFTTFQRNYPTGATSRPMFEARARYRNNSTIELIARDNWNRGDTSVTYLRIQDSFGAQTGALRIVVVIGNDAPQQIITPDIGTAPRNNLHLLGRSTDTNLTTFVGFTNVNILNHVVDRNPNDHVAITPDNNFALRIVPFEVREYAANARYISSGVVSHASLITIDYDRTAPTQTFSIRVAYGLFGTQTFTVLIRDGGTIDQTPDALTATLTFTITVARPLEYSPTIGGLSAAYRVMTSVTTERLFDIANNEVEHHSHDFNIAAFGSNGGFTPGEGFTLLGLRLEEPQARVHIYRNNVRQTGSELGVEGDAWHIRALNERASTVVIATIGIQGQGESYLFERSFTVNNIENFRPFLLARFDGVITIFMEEDMSNRTVRLHASEIFGDPEQDDVRILDVHSQTRAVVSTVHRAEYNEIMLTFHGRGASRITVTHTDVTNRVYTAVINVENHDLPALNFFGLFAASIQTNVWLYVFILIFVILLIIALIIIIATIRRRRRIREEVEALLVAELELEEKMLLLAASNSEHTYYQSHGYLPPPVQTDPNFMLGYGGGEAPANPSVMLNQGQGNQSTTRFTETRTVTEHNIPQMEGHSIPGMDDYGDDLNGL